MERLEHEPHRLRLRTSATKASFRVPLDNPSESRLRLRRRDPVPVELVSEAGRVVATARIAGKAAAGASSEAKLSVELPPTAPPGRYVGTVTAGASKVPVVVHVPVKRSLAVLPDTVFVEVARDGNEKAELLLVNDGNVPIEVGHPAAVVLEPRDRSCRILRRALVLTEEEKGIAPLDALVRASAESTKADTLLAARIEGAPFVLEPGESRHVVLTLRIRIASRGVHRARLAIAGTRVRIEVHAHHVPGGEP